MTIANILNSVKWNSDNLACAIVQDFENKDILMVAWVNPEALEKTIETGLAHYFSRSRQKQWLKGEQSGHYQKVKEIRLDCDGDAIIYKIEQVGGIACHTGRRSCFYRRYANGEWQITDEVLKDEQDIYHQH